MTQAPTTHYAVLNLPSPRPGAKAVTNKEIKTAYRLALLQHHPDKSKTPSSPPTTSIDAIKHAYTVLSSPALRREYDLTLTLMHNSVERTHHTGEEVVDLDDLNYDEGTGQWWRGCRCGEERGYVLSEAELEGTEGRGEGEVVVGCLGCSLVLRVGYGVVQEDEDEDDEEKMADARKKA